MACAYHVDVVIRLHLKPMMVLNSNEPSENGGPYNLCFILKHIFLGYNVKCVDYLIFSTKYNTRYFSLTHYFCFDESFIK